MIVAVAFCPHPPVLVPDVARSAAPELDDLRAACHAAISAITRADRRIAVVGAGARAQSFDPTARGTLRGFGVDCDVTLGSAPVGDAVLPLSLTVGAWLLGESAVAASLGVSVTGGTDTAPALLDEGDWALLVTGDASARRSTAAPGYLDERAAGFDAGVVSAMRSGDGSALAGVDASLGADLLAAGVPAWNAVGTWLGDTAFTADVLYDDAPYGVGYVVATWT